MYRVTYVDGLAKFRSKVCPMKEQTIPRLELLAANILARLSNTVSKCLCAQFDGLTRFHWTDSSVILCWIKNRKPLKQCVNQRVKEIHNLTERDSWNHCPGKENPADLPSRGVRADEIKSNFLWWNGSKFLRLPKSEWPKPLLKGTPKKRLKWK